jgi:ABC-type Fe3+ transport system substrate-binding protein
MSNVRAPSFYAAGLSVGLAIGLLASGNAGAADAELIAAARKEGEVVWYTTLIVNQAARPLADAFEKKYGIRVGFTRTDNQGLVNRVLAETRANRLIADVVDGTAGHNVLHKSGLTAQWLPDTEKSYAPEYKDPNRQWLAANLYFLSPAYNTKLVPPGEHPKTFEDLLDPKWKGGKIIWNMGDGSTGGLAFIANVLRTMGKDKGLAYLEKLSTQAIVTSEASPRTTLDQTIAGEFPLVLQVFHYHATISASKGAPVDWIPMSPLNGFFSSMSLMKNAPHPNAGKLLFDFVTSEEGQKIFQANQYIPAMTGMDAFDRRLKPGKDTFTVNYFSQQEVADSYDELRAIFDKHFR